MEGGAAAEAVALAQRDPLLPVVLRHRAFTSVGRAGDGWADGEVPGHGPRGALIQDHGGHLQTVELAEGLFHWFPVRESSFAAERGTAAGAGVAGGARGAPAQTFPPTALPLLRLARWRDECSGAGKSSFGIPLSATASSEDTRSPPLCSARRAIKSPLTPFPTPVNLGDATRDA